MNDDVNRHPLSSNHDSGPQDGMHPSVEQLSEYLDGSLEIDEAARIAIEGHLTDCQACQAVLEDLRMMVQTLRALPVREAPRDFAITHGMLEPATPPAAPQPVVLQESAQWHARHAGKVRWATAVAAMLFVFVISADLVTNGLRPSGSDDSADSATTMRDAMESEQSEESIGAMSADEPDPIPTAAAVEGEQPESGSLPSEGEEEAVPESDAVPPAVEEEAEEEAEVPQDEEEPASDDAQADQPEETTAQTNDEDAGGGEGDEDVSMFAVEEEAISDEPASETTAGAEDSSQLRWRVVEVSLALVLALLLAVMIGLPKQRGPRRR